MTDRSDVVVIGGGVMGASVALHLLEAGARNVRLLERDGLFEATSGAGGGFLGPWTALTPGLGTESGAVKVERYGLDFYAGLHEAGYDIEYRKNGILWVAASAAAWEMVQGMAFEQADPRSRVVPPDELPELTGGVIRPDGVHGTRYLPEGAQIYTRKLAVALADRITRLGGVIDTRRPATGVRVNGSRVVGVDTHTGPVDCDTVVVAAGAWNNALLEPLGYFLPAVPQVTSRIITEDIGIPEKLPVLMLQGLLPEDEGGGTVLWVRGYNGGLLWGGMYLTYPRDLLVHEPVPDRLDELPTDGVLENQRAARAARFMPALSQQASIRVKHGAPCYTPDNSALMGPVPGFDGLYCMGGDNELGVTQGPGFGKAVADTIVHGSSDLVSLDEWRLDRFGDRFPNRTEVFKLVVVSHPHPESWDMTHPNFGIAEKLLAG